MISLEEGFLMSVSVQRPPQAQGLSRNGEGRGERPESMQGLLILGGTLQVLSTPEH